MTACLLVAAGVEGRPITTVEGLTSNGALTPIQKAFVAEGAIQCGYCTPGMVLAASALLEKTPSPTREEIGEALSGNLCRCTGYVQILAAVRAAAGGARD